jgi:hypothetical protein
MFGTILENVVLDEHTRKVKFEDQSITENTRASYPLHYIPNYVPSGRGGHPKNIVFLTADAFGVLPPIAKLTREQAMYYFLSGYTAKVAGTEKGVKEPQATFSSCFGAVFLVWHPTKYAEMLGKLIDEHKSNVWLVNTGWTGGAYGVGKRMSLKHTRAMVADLLDGSLSSAQFDTDPIFGLQVPKSIANVPAEVLNPRNTWSDKSAYDAQAHKLAGMFRENFAKFEKFVPDAVKNAGPKALFSVVEKNAGGGLNELVARFVSGLYHRDSTERLRSGAPGELDYFLVKRIDGIERMPRKNQRRLVGCVGRGPLSYPRDPTHPIHPPLLLRSPARIRDQSAGSVFVEFHETQGRIEQKILGIFWISETGVDAS